MEEVNKMIDVSVIYVNYNTKELLEQSLISLNEKTIGVNYEVIVSDNGSQDGSIEMIENNFPNIVLIKNNANLGFGKANNKAIEIAKGKYLFLLNTDTYLINNAVKIMYDFMNTIHNKDVACCGGDLFDAEGKRQAAFGNFPSILDAFSQLGFFKFYKKYYEKYITGGVLNYDSNIKTVDYLCGADMFLRRSLMDMVGYFDEDFFLYFEETEMSYRIKKAGYESVIIPEAKIVHLEGGSQNSEKINVFKINQFAKSRRIYFEKTRGVVIANFVKYIFVLQNVIFFLLKRNTTYLKIAKIINKA